MAFSDVNGKQAEETATELQGARAYRTGEALIEPPEVQAVLVTSSGPTHEAYVLGAIKVRKPVFCEKRLAATAEACLRIVEAEIDCGRRLVQVGFQRRYDKVYRALKEAIDDGVIGAPLMVHCAHRNPSVPEAYVSDMAIVDTFIHEIDALRWLINDDYVSAQVIVPCNTRHTHAKLSAPIMVLLATKSGVRIDGEVFVNFRYGYDIQCQVVGEEGVACLPAPESVILRCDAKLSNAIAGLEAAVHRLLRRRTAGLDRRGQDRQGQRPYSLGWLFRSRHRRCLSGGQAHRRRHAHRHAPASDILRLAPVRVARRSAF
jgi:myo-inositol 2-dehydrogenase/D-chiro-inositol 1-dehydrogenase